MKRDADVALTAYFQALAAEPIPAIEVRLGRRMTGPIIPLAAGICAAALLPMVTPAKAAAPQPVMGVASLSDEESVDQQSMLESEDESWAV